MARYDYTALDKVKRLIRSVSGDVSVQKKVKFSDTHTLPKKYTTNVGSGMLLDLDIIGTYVGFEHWKVVFTSETEFILYRGEDELAVDGSGAIGATFLSDSNIITILPIYWVGSFEVGDCFQFQTESNISNMDAEAFMSDAEDIVNGMLEKYFGEDIVPFDGVPVPTKIDTGTAYIAAFLIYSSIYSATNQKDIPEFVSRWYRSGKNMVAAYLETISGRLKRKAKFIPRFKARVPLFDSVGLDAVQGIGLAMGDTHGKIDTLNVKFDKNYNTRET